MSAARVFIYVQHLLGIGHLKRAAVLARSLAARDLEVMLASGGLPVPGLALGGARLVQLPPARAADLGFKVEGRTGQDAARGGGIGRGRVGHALGQGPLRGQKGGLATMRGQGSADVASCRAENSRVLSLLSSVLQVPELANPDFEACRVEFNQTGSRFSTPVVKLTGDAVRLSGRGSVNLDTSGLYYQMTLALAPKLFAKIPRPELRAGFQQGEGGFATIDLRLYGTTLEPKTDLLSRLGKAAATGVAKDQLNKLLKTKIF